MLTGNNEWDLHRVKDMRPRFVHRLTSMTHLLQHLRVVDALVPMRLEADYWFMPEPRYCSVRTVKVA